MINKIINLLDKFYGKIESISGYYNNLNNISKVERTNDLIPKGIKSTIKSDNHGKIDDYNNAWLSIYSQRRNLNKIKI